MRTGSQLHDLIGGIGLGRGQQGGDGEADSGAGDRALLDLGRHLLDDAALVLVGRIVELVERGAANIEEHPADYRQK